MTNSVSDQLKMTLISQLLIRGSHIQNLEQGTRMNNIFELERTRLSMLGVSPRSRCEKRLRSKELTHVAGQHRRRVLPNIRLRNVSRRVQDWLPQPLEPLGRAAVAEAPALRVEVESLSRETPRAESSRVPRLWTGAPPDPPPPPRQFHLPDLGAGGMLRLGPILGAGGRIPCWVLVIYTHAIMPPAVGEPQSSILLDQSRVGSTAHVFGDSNDKLGSELPGRVSIDWNPNIALRLHTGSTEGMGSIKPRVSL